jgi:Cof subfamily protein (haloacid dehalogenase superfamily)
METVSIRLIATDLDGTLLRSDGTVSERSVAALRAAEDAGVAVVVATGRPPRWVRPVAEFLQHTGLAICANGAVLVDLHSERILETRPLTREVIVKVTEVIRADVPGVAFAVETTNHGFGREPSYRTHSDDLLQRPRVAPIGELAADDVVKLLVRHEQMNPDALLDQARELAGDLAEFTHSSRSALLEVSAAGVTKAATLATVAEQFGVQAADVLAFGDMPNDLPMLAWAGTAYGMANAHPDVLAAVDLVAPHHDDDGVAQVLEDRFATS